VEDVGRNVHLDKTVVLIIVFVTYLYVDFGLVLKVAAGA
jgi:hypothetical protein